MEENWEIYPCLIEDEIAIVAVDLARLEGAPLATHPLRLEVRVPLRVPDEDGLAGEEEMTDLLGIESQLFADLAESSGALALGHVTTRGERVWYFQVAKASGLDAAVAESLEDAEGYVPSITAVDDPEWELYRGLLVPEPLEFQSIQNRRMCSTLLEHGDDLQLPRVVTHWAFFPTEEERARFRGAVEGQGFATHDDRLPEDEEGNPQPLEIEGELCLCFERKDSVDVAQVDELVLPLFELAEQCGGRYDGWETTVEGLAS